MSFLTSVWYVAALENEVTEGVLFHRTILGQAVLMYRKSNGDAVAMADRCPHRFASLHRGVLKDDVVECPYHGLQFDCTGACVHNPHGDGLIPKAAVVRTFPLVERYGFLWIWMGDASADASKIPDYSFFDGALPTSVGFGYLYAPVHYEVMTDNIMDLSHADFVHGPLLQTHRQLTGAKAKVTEKGDDVEIRWEWVQEPPQGFFAQFLPSPTGPARQWVEVGWSAAASMYLHVGAVQGDKPYEEGLVFWAVHIMTPETETSTHYFYGGRRNWLINNDELNKSFLAATLNTFRTEDLPIVEDVQAAMGGADLLSLKPVLLACDAGAVRARRKLSSLLHAVKT